MRKNIFVIITCIIAWNQVYAIDPQNTTIVDVSNSYITDIPIIKKMNCDLISYNIVDSVKHTNSLTYKIYFKKICIL